MRKLVLVVLLCAISVYADKLPIGTRFAVAIEDGDLDAVKALIEEEGAKVDTPIEYGESSITPLQKASWDGALPIVEYLLSKGANVNARDTQSHETALSNAVKRGHVDIVKMLLAAKADVSLRDKFDFNVFT